MFPIKEESTEWKNNMKQVYKLEDFNGVDGGTLTLHTDGENNLLMLCAEKGEEQVSVYVTIENLQEMITSLELKKGGRTS